MYRKTTYAGSFYPKESDKCREAIEYCTNQAQKKDAFLSSFADKKWSAGIAPHAGWAYSGPTMACVYEALKKSEKIETFLVFGAIHVPGVKKATLWGEGKWQTPLGDIEVDNELSQELVSSAPEYIEINPDPHYHEHSIEVLLPFIKYFFPQAKIVPLMIPPCLWAVEVGRRIGKLTSSSVFALASTDLTHYGTRFGYTPAGIGEEALSWVKKVNDHSMIRLMEELREEEVIEEARKNANACGAGAVAATLAFARRKEKEKGCLLDYTTSWDIAGGYKDNFVGYCAMVF